MQSHDDMFAYMDSQLAEPKPEFPSFIDVDLCKNCKKHGGIVNNTCRLCGYTSNIFISQEAEWKSCVSESGKAYDPSRVGMVSNPLYSDNWGKGTLMTVKRGKQQTKYHLTQRIALHSGMNHKDRALHHAYDDFDKAGKIKMGLNDSVMVNAKAYYKNITEETLTRGAVRVGTKANCLFLACKDAGVPRSTQEIADAFGIETKDISRTADKVKDIIHPKNKITMPADFVQRIFNELDLGTDIQVRRTKMKCIRLCDDLKTCSKLMSKTPKAVAATVIWAELGTSKQSMFRASGVSVATISKLDAIIKGWNGN